MLSLVVLAALAWAVTSVPLGKRTLWGHLSAIWSTPEAKDMQAGIKEAATPALEKMRRGAEAGLKAAGEPAPDAAPNAAPDEAIGGAAAKTEQAQETAVQLWGAARRAGAAAKHAEAADLAERSFLADPTLAAAAVFAVEAYCKAGQTLGARRMAQELGAASRKAVATTCAASGVVLDGR